MVLQAARKSIFKMKETFWKRKVPTQACITDRKLQQKEGGLRFIALKATKALKGFKKPLPHNISISKSLMQGRQVLLWKGCELWAHKHSINISFRLFYRKIIVRFPPLPLPSFGKMHRTFFCLNSQPSWIWSLKLPCFSHWKHMMRPQRISSSGIHEKYFLPFV